MVKLFQRKRRKNSSGNLLLLFALLLMYSCKDTTPTTYTSVKGTWNCHEVSFQRNIKYPVDIYKSKSGDSNYLFSNFHNDGYENIFVNSQLQGNKLTISNQSLNQAGLIVKSGSGTVNDTFTEIQLSYTVFNGTVDLQVNATYYR